MNQFNVSSIHCPLTQITIEPDAAGGPQDFTSAFGVVTLVTNHNSVDIQLQVPPIDLDQFTFTFRIKAVSGTGNFAEGFTELIKIRLTNCSYSIPKMKQT